MSMLQWSRQGGWNGQGMKHPPPALDIDPQRVQDALMQNPEVRAMGVREDLEDAGVTPGTWREFQEYRQEMMRRKARERQMEEQLARENANLKALKTGIKEGSVNVERGGGLSRKDRSKSMEMF